MTDNRILTSEYDESSVLVITKENFLENYDRLVQIIRRSPEYLKLADCTQIIFDEKGNNKVHNRQTHTERVAKLSFLLAKKFGLNEKEQKMAELIGICHDLGHTAFGHTGENRIDEVLKYFGISSQEFNDSYVKRNNSVEVVNSLGRYQEMEHSFEHHAHSTRVLRKILKDNNIEISEDIMDDLEWGILCHSESRAKIPIKKPLWTIARYADKFYAFTDIYDIIRSGNDIPRNIFEKIEKDEKTVKALSDKGIELTNDDSDSINAALEKFEDMPKNVLEYFADEYVNNANLDIKNGSYFISTDGKIGRQMRILQAIVKYMRREKVIGKEEKLADAMVDEIIAYKIEDFDKDENGEYIMSERERQIETCIFVSEARDTELRNLYRIISADKKWVESFNEKMKSEDYHGFETKISEEDRAMMRENPDIILNYYFDKEITKVSDEKIKSALIGELLEYRTAPSLEKRKELIRKIEEAKAGGNPFSVYGRHKGFDVNR